MTLQLKKIEGGVVLNVRAQPGAKKTRLVSLYGDGVKVAVAAPPVDGKANAALVEFLAELFGLRRSQVELVEGETTTAKALLLRGMTVSELTQRLGELLG